MKKIYIISRYTAPSKHEINFNLEVARYYCRKIALSGDKPIAPHLYYTQFLVDSNNEERSLGLKHGIDELAHCDAYLVILVDGIYSQGMQYEMLKAKKFGISGNIVSVTKKEIKKAIKGKRYGS